MNGEQPVRPGAPSQPPGPADSNGSGEGADTALEALIRKRRGAEPPEGPEPRPSGHRP